MWFALSGIGYVIAYAALFSTLNSGSIYAATIIIGICYGGIWAIMACLVRDMFGGKNFGFNFGLLNGFTPLPILYCIYHTDTRTYISWHWSGNGHL